jgi:hypothetical protein
LHGRGEKTGNKISESIVETGQQKKKVKQGEKKKKIVLNFECMILQAEEGGLISILQVTATGEKNKTTQR